MHTTTLRKVGGSIMLAVPPVLLDALHLQSGVQVDLSIDGGCLLVAPKKRFKYTLQELLAQCEAETESSSEDRAWLESPPAGRELL
jgi:antitoxin ChpS